MLKIRRSKVRSLQLMQVLDLYRILAHGSLKRGTVNLDTWSKVGDTLRM
jgi:hypothetical protein